MLADDDAEYDRVMPRDDAAVELRRAGVDDRMALRDRRCPVRRWRAAFQDRAAVIGRAADQETVGGLAPILLQPPDVGLKAPAVATSAEARISVAPSIGCSNSRTGTCCLDLKIGDFGVIDDLHAEFFGGEIERVQHARPPPRRTSWCGRG